MHILVLGAYGSIGLPISKALMAAGLCRTGIIRFFGARLSAAFPLSSV